MASGLKGGKMKTNNFKKLTLIDVMCPVCMSIFIEPVTLPCQHGLCLECFERTVENASLCCPMCRKRIGGWLRTANKDKGLVNHKLWTFIKQRFPEEVEAKLNGGEDIMDHEIAQMTPPVQVSKTGEIRREYELELQRLALESRKKVELEQQASEQLIRKLQEEEEIALRSAQEKLKRQTEEDEVVARKVQEEVEKEAVKSTASSSSIFENDNQPISVTPVRGPMDMFVKSHSNIRTKPLGVADSSSNTKKRKISDIDRVRSNSNVSNSSHDSINQEMHHFKPIRVCPLTPPKVMPDGRILEPRFIKATPVNLNNIYDAMESGKKIEPRVRPIFQRRLLNSKQYREERKSPISSCTTAPDIGSSNSSAFRGLAFSAKAESSIVSSHKIFRTPKKKFRSAESSNENFHSMNLEPVMLSTSFSQSDSLCQTPTSCSAQYKNQGSSPSSVASNEKKRDSDSDESVTDFEDPDISKMIGVDIESDSSPSKVKDVLLKSKYVSNASLFNNKFKSNNNLKNQQRRYDLENEISVEPAEITVDAKIVNEQALIEKQIIQEQADLALAIRLQKEWDEIDRKVDRSKGSSRAYELRNSFTTSNSRHSRQRTLEESFVRGVKTGRR